MKSVSDNRTYDKIVSSVYGSLAGEAWWSVQDQVWRKIQARVSRAVNNIPDTVEIELFVLKYKEGNHGPVY